MERVSQEWLSSIDQDALNKSGFGLVKSRDAYVLHLVQAVARECSSIAASEAARLQEKLHLMSFMQVHIDQGVTSARRDAMLWVISEIRARFGMEDD